MSDEQTISETLESLLDRPAPMEAAGGRALRQVLLDPATPVSLLQAILQYAEKLMNDQGETAQKQAAETLYYAAAAMARAIHGQRIIERTDQQLREAYGRLMEQLWVPEELAELFAKARSGGPAIEGVFEKTAKTFGDFQAVIELSHTPETRVFAGARADRPQAHEFCIKVFRPLCFTAGAEAIRRAIDGFAESAKLQQRLANTSKGRWVAVHQVGQIPGGAFAVYDRCDHSAGTLIRSKIGMDPWAMHHIVSSVARALAMLEESDHRPHGRLGADNILLIGRGRISSNRVALSDPAPTAALDVAQARAADLGAVGELIYSLVRHRGIERQYVGMLEPDAQWRGACGKKAEGWCRLCNRLLDAGAGVGEMTLKSLGEELAALSPGGLLGRLFGG